MAPSTWTAVKKVLAGTSNYILNDSIEGGFSGRLLGKPVYTSDQVEAMAASKRAVFYVNPAEALATKLVEDSVQILNEKYAVQHAVGVVAWYEADCKVQNQQAAAVLVMKAS
jgi:HK97 family phage major capsid protein